jgi:IS605 OrfB family transposase
VKLTAKVKILASADDAKTLTATMQAANAACDWISEQAWNAKVFGQFALHKLTYTQARERFGLSAQVVVRCIGKVADSYKLDKKKRRSFWKYGAVTYDDRILSWNLTNQTVSIWTTEGRRRFTFEAGPRQLALLSSRQGESDLILHRKTFYVAACCEVQEPDPSDVDDFLGVDLGVNQIAVDSDGKHYSGSAIKNVRWRQRKLRARLQAKQTHSAKRKLRHLSGKEQRFAANVNHCIAKDIVETARRTGRGLAVEDLSGIRDRIRARRDQRAVLHSWAFAQLRGFLEYKSALAGVPLVAVDPRNSSRECSRCSHTEKSNRPSQSLFRCKSCGFTTHADFNAATNLRNRGRATVNRPNAPQGRPSGGFQPQAQATGF